MTKLTRSQNSLEIREIGEDGTIKGYISVFGVEDSYETKFNAGCFARSIQERGDKPLMMLFNHDRDQIIGKWTELREDGHGLFGVGRITDKTERGREMRGLVGEDMIDGLSHGFYTREFDAKTRSFNDVDLLEASLVAMASCPGAALRGDAMTRSAYFESISRDTGLPREQLLGNSSEDTRAAALLKSLSETLNGEIRNGFSNLY